MRLNSGGAALGMPVRELPADEAATYKRLEDAQHGLDIEVQIVSHGSRVHLDIESDDIEAEVRRLEQLGAKRVQAIHTGGSWRPRRVSAFAWYPPVRRHSRKKPPRGPDDCFLCSPVGPVALRPGPGPGPGPGASGRMSCCCCISVTG